MNDEYINIPSGQFNRDIFHRVLAWAIEHKHSDIEFVTGKSIAVRKGNEYIPVTRHVIPEHLMMEVLNEAFGEPNIDIVKNSPRAYSGVYTFNTSNNEDTDYLRFRAEITSVLGTEGSGRAMECLLRPIQSHIPTVEDVGIPPEIYENFVPDQGLVVVAGPTGSGKTTTTASCLQHFAQNHRSRIITYEDPIEYDLNRIPNNLSRISQSEVSDNGNLRTFPLAAKNMVRRSPLVVFYGEARDRESINGAIEGCRTGHPVITTNHANSASEIMARMSEVFGEDRERIIYALAETCSFFLFQRLINAPNKKGRIAVREHIRLTSGVQDEIRHGLMKHGCDAISTIVRDVIFQSDEGKSFTEDLVEKYLSGWIELEAYLEQLQIRGIEYSGGFGSSKKLIFEGLEVQRADGRISNDQFNDKVSFVNELDWLKE